ncbi:tRNA 2-thiouridine(34) synthase MnmA [Candidatus Methylopumilus planktonicus]|jgi:tRNA-specific 2-thiouridylase|uniref:tRNA 2-thiouridine(34) synthase MnmA n=1 Tax=Candidatus Methylopumilus planktonicus TaxID=1581557 RepID=UPI0011245642|nr:tRNA 2-thiouridine(34) synthase MnmA [Candidatus Methylopumilus planktonicus]QDD10605.1 tRNA 2-thiouridine(34) synthase MnmA [Candidatus Methylopumilus planktonicus]QDD23074.1 tRNA 2-thiouridine(34) synthase MnmA [Candidatus Methylopumilus planktonicus]
MNNSTVIVGLSGGVDSSVAALLLKNQGYKVVGLFMKNWEDDDDDEYCSSKQDLLDAVSVADKIGIDIEVVNFSKEYKEKVFSEFINEIKSGKTPNPDILCNSEIKFNAFLNHAISMGADKIATGHYAQIKEADGLYSLLKADDSTKDQSYFLYRLNQHQLSKSLFPLGNLLKKDVREIAKKEGLHNSDKKDSTGICFIGERPFTEFLNKYIENSPGPIKDEHGKILGEHIGLMFYTLGQRQGLGIGGSKTSNGEPWFVAEKSIKENILIVAQGHAHPLLFKDGLIAKKPHWIHGALPEKHWVYGAKTRYRESDAPCEIDMIKDDSVEIFFGQKQWAITPGQSVVVYESNVCLGGAIIECAIDKAQVPLPEKIVAS